MLLAPWHALHDEQCWGSLYWNHSVGEGVPASDWWLLQFVIHQLWSQKSPSWTCDFHILPPLSSILQLTLSPLLSICFSHLTPALVFSQNFCIFQCVFRYILAYWLWNDYRRSFSFLNHFATLKNVWLGQLSGASSPFYPGHRWPKTSLLNGRNSLWVSCLAEASLGSPAPKLVLWEVFNGGRSWKNT